MSDTLQTIVVHANHIPLETDEIFTFIGDDGTTLFVNSSKLRRDIAAGCKAVPETIHFSMEDVAHVLMSNGVEQSKLRRLRSRPDIYMQPPLVIDLETGKSIVVDGNHRIAILASMGHMDIVCLRAPPETWRECLLDFPPMLAQYLVD